MNLQEELKALKERIAELEKQEKEECEFPQYGDDYWCVDETGNILYENWEGFGIEKDMLEIGNIFKTEEQAEFVVEKLKVEAELRKFGRGYVNGSNNWYILYDFDKDKVMRTNELRHFSQGVIYFRDTYTAREAIESAGEERIKKYIFGVED